MKISQSFQVARPLSDVWDLFHDIPSVARCMPGAELTEDMGDGKYAGKLSIRLGPFGAAFDGEVQVTREPASHSGHAEGRGLDKKGGSRSKLVMDYRLEAVEEATAVFIDADVQLAGPIAQFGRTGIITETTNERRPCSIRNVRSSTVDVAGGGGAIRRSLRSPQPRLQPPE